MRDTERIVELERRVARLEEVIKQLATAQGVSFDLVKPPGEVDPAILDALRRGQKIEAVQIYRNMTNLDLKASKDYIDEVEQRMKRGEL